MQKEHYGDTSLRKSSTNQKGCFFLHIILDQFVIWQENLPVCHFQNEVAIKFKKINY